MLHRLTLYTPIITILSANMFIPSLKNRTLQFSSIVNKRFLVIPRQIPSNGLIKLNSSKFLQISGPDATIFINGLTTIKMLPKHLKKNQTTISTADINNETIVNSINLSSDEINSTNWGILHESEEFDPENPHELPMRLGIRRDGRYSLILRANGRIFSDIFVYPSPFINNGDNKSIGPQYIIEILNKSQFKPIQMMLKLHKLRSKVDIKELKLSTWFYYNDSENNYKIYDTILDNYFNNSKSKNSTNANLLAENFIKDNLLSINKELINNNKLYGFTIDDRFDYFGFRFITDESNDLPIIDNTQIIPNESYISRRIKYGIVENSDFDNISTLPFECNVDWMRGINFEKGCYMGQELTIRTWTGNGTMRRVLPIKFEEEIPNLNDYNEKLELRVIDEKNQKTESNSAAYNPFGTTADTNKPIRSRRDTGKVGEVLISDGLNGLARIDKRYFDWDQIQQKKVKVIHNDKTYFATIDSSIWNE